MSLERGCHLLGWDAFLLFGFGGMAKLELGAELWLSGGCHDLAVQMYLQVSEFKASCGPCKLKGAEGVVWFERAKEKADCVMSV